MSKPKVLLAMSGGTDSSASAMMLQEHGYEVIGVTLNLYGELQSDTPMPTFIADAKSVAQRLNIRHLVYEASARFQTIVLDRFVGDYLDGKTPFPCVVCNPLIKWAILKEVADSEGCEWIASGHYAQIERWEGRSYIAPAVDQDKDQSFFLWNIPEGLLDRILFPLGGMNKQDVRAYAFHRGFETIGQKKDSMGICFIEGSDYRPYLRNSLEVMGKPIGPGDLIDGVGKVIGRHEGFPFYTIGQRRGLNHGQNQALFVTEILAATNQVRLGAYNELKRRSIEVVQFAFYYAVDFDASRIYTLKIRYRNQSTPCMIQLHGDGGAILTLLEDVYAVAPGQSAVLFYENKVMGGGFIFR